MTITSSAPSALVQPIAQYSVRRILVTWAVATLPMGAGAWVIAPWLASKWNDGNGLLRGILLALTCALIWQFLMVAFLVYREQGTLRWPVVREALWLQVPYSPRREVRSRRAWWMLIPAILVLTATQAIPSISAGPDERNLALVLQTDAGADFFAGNWGWFALVVVMLVFNTVLGEELLFRGLLLPRMYGAFGNRGWIVNSVLFALYHVHQPWTMANTFLASTVFSYTTHRYRSAWFGIITHSMQTLIISALVLSLVVA
ncbi:MAG: CPBP family intramembrane metalloprotease [Actinobacteria bacterium HGW-Actinobacteria-4]|nr:MAG: CPBP family intramembrane metalloprotease [Actinobacteria bacterium HGW-Actinobacteria-4]